MNKRSFIRYIIILVMAALSGLLIRQNKSADCTESPTACEHCGQAHNCSKIQSK